MGMSNCHCHMSEQSGVSRCTPKMINQHSMVRGFMEMLGLSQADDDVYLDF